MTLTVDVMSKPLLRIGTMDGKPFADIVFNEKSGQTIDERIAKIDAARSNLVDALAAIDELKAAAGANKTDLHVALEQLETTQAKHNAARRELDLVRQVANSDVETFQRLAGVQSKTQIAKERALGFVFGIVASLLASGIWWGGSQDMAVPRNMSALTVRSNFAPSRISRPPSHILHAGHL